MNYSFHRAAVKELNEAIDYYNHCRTGLGNEFAQEIIVCIQNILTLPDAWQKYLKTLDDVYFIVSLME